MDTNKMGKKNDLSCVVAKHKNAYGYKTVKYTKFNFLMQMFHMILLYYSAKCAIRKLIFAIWL